MQFFCTFKIEFVDVLFCSTYSKVTAKYKNLKKYSIKNSNIESNSVYIFRFIRTIITTPIIKRVFIVAVDYNSLNSKFSF